jgi:hypothetical protein
MNNFKHLQRRPTKKSAAPALQVLHWDGGEGGIRTHVPV